VNDRSRRFTSLATSPVRAQLTALLHAETAADYRAAMKHLGASLGAELSSRLPRSGPFAIVSTPEDADALIAGMLDELPRRRARLVCYWTRRSRFDDGDVATVVQRYEDPRLGGPIDSVIVAKSIISSGCVARTHLEQFLALAQPKRVFVAAPVMLKGADRALKRSFSGDVSSKLDFVTFAVDARRSDDGIVLPGVGGVVERRLGLTDVPARKLPALVASWSRSVS
jgi:hypothetical protein